MLLDRVYKEKFYLSALISYMVLTVFTGSILNNGLILFLTINMFLAGVSWILSIGVSCLKDKGYKLWIVLILTIVWILFFPNAMYITTDFIHLQNYEFFGIYSQTYVFILEDWIVLFLIFLGAMISAKLGVESIKNVFSSWKLFNSKWLIIYLSGLFVISSIGIYIGRFIRLNSWDFYRLDIIFEHIWQHFEFFIGFVLLFTAIHFIYYVLFKQSKK
ncbi:DUF1361 domain-containing protein [Mycoplasmatota bacterium]|nr:DUF1361 domain-containing protein [Mycoplasmatota bacterium]